ncbi:MAG: hypothetical protein RIF33_10935 [Cyclobacteriaceae bacterium]
MKIALTTLLCLSIQLSSFAQQQEIKDFFTAYIAEINNLNKTKDLTKVMTYFSPDFQVNRTFIGPNGRVERTVLNLDAFAQSLQSLTTERDVEPNLKIEQISKIIEGPTTATISVVLSLNMNVDGALAEQGGYVSNYALVKNKTGEWKLVHSDVIRTLTQRNAGSCPCRFYPRESSLVAELYYPAGFEYKNELESFKFRTVDKRRYITNNLKEYEWDLEGSVYQMENGNRVKMGEAKTQEDAAKAILGQLYRVHCLSFRRL